MRRELGLEVGGGRAGARLHLHTGLDERTELVRQPLEVRALAQQHEHRFDGVRAMKGRVPGRGEDEGRAEREHIARAGHAARVLGLLGRHVRRGADGDVRHGQTRVGDARRDTEVDDARPVLDYEHVRRLEVAVDQPRAVDGLQRLGDAGRQPAHRLDRQRPVLVHYLLERGRGDVGGGEPGDGGARVGVHHRGRVEAGHSPGRLHLAGEADAEQLVLCELGPDGLDRHAPARRRPCEIDQPHAPGTQPAQHLERPDPPRIVLRQLIHHFPATSPYAAATWQPLRSVSPRIATVPRTPILPFLGTGC
ncbi:hypothetical protein STSP_18070 [Streptomyces jeddahensis]|uniref:Uncharacterized protein n=1 Tax=Streptomyces jeddahensis TaxID=1716141 RepID=A0A177HXI9_9ACTN|nr:hypothetical protein STSP_18070 [Streptomyces jeddahensis]